MGMYFIYSPQPTTGQVKDSCGGILLFIHYMINVIVNTVLVDICNCKFYLYLQIHVIIDTYESFCKVNTYTQVIHIAMKCI